MPATAAPPTRQQIEAKILRLRAQVLALPQPRGWTTARDIAATRAALEAKIDSELDAWIEARGR